MPGKGKVPAEIANVSASRRRDRSRIMSNECRKRLFSLPNVFPGTVLVDGFVAGRWRMGRSRTAATLTAELFGERGSGHDRDAITGEAGRVLTFAAPQAGAHEVRFAALRPTAAG
jgi:DNA glycosylase AlkZ-like